MNNYIKLFLVLTLLLGLFSPTFLGDKVAYAQSYSHGDNGPQIVVDKKVRSVDNDSFFDNLTSNQKVFLENDQIEFSIRVENRGDINLTNIKVTDYLPKYLTLFFYPGVLNVTEHKIEDTIDNLNPGEVKEYVVRARITDVPKSNIADSMWQITNKVCASNSVASDCDDSRYFIGLNTTPATGSNDIYFGTLLGVFVSLIALKLRMFARGY